MQLLSSVIPFPAPRAYNYAFIGGYIPAKYQQSSASASAPAHTVIAPGQRGVDLCNHVCSINRLRVKYSYLNTNKISAAAFNLKYGSKLRETPTLIFLPFSWDSKHTLMQHISGGSTYQKVVRGMADSGGGGRGPRGGRLLLHSVFTLWTIQSNSHVMMVRLCVYVFVWIWAQTRRRKWSGASSLVQEVLMKLVVPSCSFPLKEIKDLKQSCNYRQANFWSATNTAHNVSTCVNRKRSEYMSFTFHTWC